MRDSLTSADLEALADEVLGAPVYIAFAHEAGIDVASDVLALNHGRLDLHLERHLREAGRWRGRRPAVLLNDQAIGAWANERVEPENLEAEVKRVTFGTLAHELSHVLLRPWPHYDDSPSVLDWDYETAMFKALATLPSDQVRQRTAMMGRSPWAGHEAKFIRMSLHCGFRLARASGVEIAAAVIVSTQSYELSHTCHYAATISDEVVRLADVALADLARIAPPPAFRSLWTSDLRAWFLSLESPTAEQTRAFTTGVNLFDLPTAKEPDNGVFTGV